MYFFLAYLLTYIHYGNNKQEAQLSRASLLSSLT